MIVTNARDAADLVEPLFADAGGEKLAIVHLDERRRVIAVDERPARREAEAALPVREIVAEALRLGSRGLILAHNHPSGDAEPSRADAEATRRFADTAASLGIRLHDHLVFGGGEWRSMRAQGLL